MIFIKKSFPLMIKVFIVLLFLFGTTSIDAQGIMVTIEVGSSPNVGKKQVSVKYKAVGGDFQSGDGTDEWNAKTITLGWGSGTGMTVSAPAANTDITSFDAPSSFSFVDNFTSSANITSYTLDQIMGTDDGNIYTTFVVNGSTSNQSIADGEELTVFTFDVPDTWTGGANSVFLLTTQPSGPSIGLAPVINNSVLGQVWDGIAAGDALPVELQSFSARAIIDKKQTQLDWITVSEINNEGFEIQRRDQNNRWEAIGFQAGYGDANTFQNYQFIDRNPFSGVNYYRLKQIDFDGKYSFSKIESVEFKEKQIIYNIYPNPTANKIHLDQVFEGTLIVSDLLGQIFHEKIYARGTHSIDLSELPNGQYFLKIIPTEGNLQSAVFILQRGG